MNIQAHTGKTHRSFFRGFSRWVVLGVLVLGSIVGNAQIVQTYADQVSFDDHVDNAGNAVDNTVLTDYATLNSFGGVLLGGGAYSGEIELQFPSSLPAGTTTYVKIDFDADVLNALLGGELGSALADLLGTVLLGNHYFEIKVPNSSGPDLTGSSQIGFGGDKLRLIIDSNGNYFMAITPSFSYDRIQIKDITNAVLLGTSNSMNVYYAYYTTGQDPCEAAFATSFDGSGGTLDIANLGSSGVTNPEFAIDGNVNSYSELSLGVLTISGSLYQTIYFQSLSDASDEYHLTIRVADPSLLTLGLLDGVKIEAMDGTTVVSTKALSSLLSLNLLNLLNTGQKGDVSFAPGVPFDRIRVTITSMVQLNLTKTVDIFEVYRSPAPPTNPAGVNNVEICFDTPTSVALTATTPSTNELVWYADEHGGTPLATTAYNGTYTTILSDSTTIYVAAKRISLSCPWESSRIPIEVVELPDIGNPTLTITNTND